MASWKQYRVVDQTEHGTGLDGLIQNLATYQLCGLGQLLNLSVLSLVFPYIKLESSSYPSLGFNVMIK